MYFFGLTVIIHNGVNMYEVTKETLKNSYKPFDVVSTKNGDVGFIDEVNINSDQSDPKYQIKYSVKWLVDSENKVAWWNHKELTLHCNLFIKIAECTCHSSSRNSNKVQSLFNNMDR